MKSSLFFLAASVLLGSSTTQGHSMRADSIPTNQDCSVGPWGPYSPCDTTTGLKTRTRSIINAPLGEGAACPDLQQSAFCPETFVTTTGRNKKIIILGAGISGVAAAKMLAVNGFNNFVIVDANDYVGGRMKAKYNWAGRTVEAGANWIVGLDGTNPNPLVSLAEKYNLSTVETDFYSDTFVPEGIPDIEGTSNRFDIAYEAMIARSERYTKQKKSDFSLKQAMEYEGFMGNTPLERTMLYTYFDLEEGPIASISSQSTLNLYANPPFGEGDNFVQDKDGFSKIPRQLLSEALGKVNDTRLRLNTLVKEVAYDSNGVTVKTQSGEKITGDYAISTFSIGVMQHKHKSLFKPNLPETKLDAIFHKGMMTYTKIFLEFPINFWTKYTGGTEYFTYVANEEPRYVWWQDLTLPMYADSLTKPKPKSHVLVVVTSGTNSERIETMNDQNVLDEIMAVLPKMFPKATSIPRATNIFFPRWRFNELYYGSYSYKTPGFRTKEDYATLQQPLNRLYFAGEHTSELHSGYVHGGYLSGISAARNIMVNAGMPASLIKDI